MTSLGLIVALLIVGFAWTWVWQSRRPYAGPADAPVKPLVTGATILICHRMAVRQSRETLSAGWATARAGLVQGHAAETGHRSYAQVLQVSRWNVIYMLLRISRSWPVIAPFSVLHGLPIPRLRVRDAEAKREDWDLIEVLDFVDNDAAHRFLQSEAAAALAQDALHHTVRSQAVPMTATRAFLRGTQAPEAVVTLLFLRARQVLGRDGMIDYWLDRHRPYVQGLEPVLGYAWYDQLIARGAEHMADPADALNNAPGASWDGVASIGYTHMRDVTRGLWDLRIQATNVALVYDETRFIDLSRSSLMLGEVRLVVRAEAAAAQPKEVRVA